MPVKGFGESGPLPQSDTRLALQEQIYSHVPVSSSSMHEQIRINNNNNTATTMKHSDQQILLSWKTNAQPWVTAVREGEIESRLLVTNQAIIDAVMQQSPASVLDVGCGEGWLVRELGKRGIHVMGIDAIPELISHANQAGSGEFRVLAYEELSPHTLQETFDVMICNFSLPGHESVQYLFQQAPTVLNPAGRLIVQTLHPVSSCGNLPYQDGWRDDSWTGFNLNP